MRGTMRARLPDGNLAARNGDALDSGCCFLGARCRPCAPILSPATAMRPTAEPLLSHSRAA